MILSLRLKPTGRGCLQPVSVGDSKDKSANYSPRTSYFTRLGHGEGKSHPRLKPQRNRRVVEGEAA